MVMDLERSVLQMHYILDENGKPINPKSMDEYYRWIQLNGKSLKVTEINPVVKVSTCFLGMDHSWFGKDDPTHAPVVFETMIFGGKHDCWQDRYCNKNVALADHDRVVERLKAGLDPDEDEGVENE